MVYIYVNERKKRKRRKRKEDNDNDKDITQGLSGQETLFCHRKLTGYH